MAEIVRSRRREKHPGEDEKAIETIQEEKKIEEKQVEKVEKVVELEAVEKWQPKTEIGRKVKNNEITNINEILDKGIPILEYQIVDKLLPNLEYELLNIGQSKGKFGGGKKSIWKQTQKKTKEGNKPKFATIAVIGNKNGYVGIGYGKAKETVPAREKAVKNAKLNIIKISRGCGEWACSCKEPHSIPFKVYGRCGSVRIYLSPAPKGTGLIIEVESRKLLEFAGIKDVYSKTFGQTRSRLNLIKACFESLKRLVNTKVQEDYVKKSGTIEGAI